MQPSTTEQILGLAIQLQQAGRIAQAESIYRQVLKEHPNQPLALHDLGTLLYQADRRDEAAACWTRAVSLQPNLPEAHYNLGNVWRDYDRLDDAIASYRQAIALRPNFAPAWTNLANALRSIGLIDEAVVAYRKALEVDPNPRIASSLIFAMHFQPTVEPGQIFEQCARWNAAYAGTWRPQAGQFENDRAPERRLRIGYVSPDFRRHSQSQFTVPLLSHHDHERFQVFCYSDVGSADSLTHRIKGYADTWRDIVRSSDQQVRDMIRRDGIDILVDLTMHMDRNRLLVFARKPAPIQVTWLAYPGTTGLAAIDYRLSDRFLDPLSTSSTGSPQAGSGQAPSAAGGLCENRRFYSERTILLPDSFWCYDPLTSGPPVNAPPAAQTGFVTFGCLNNFSKVNDLTLDLWATVLRQSSNSRLLLLAPIGSARQRVTEKLAAQGIGPGRVEFVNRQLRPEYLRTYHRIDLCLDTGPYNGHTTMLDSLWMGVATVSLSGPTSVSRGGRSILSNLGLPELAADTPEQYVQFAIDLARDLPRLSELRGGLRRRMEASPLMDQPRYARAIEAAFREAWRAWCSGPM